MILTIGIEPDLKLTERLTFIQEDLGKILSARGADSRWQRPEHLCMPLLYLGHMDEDEVPDILKLLNRELRNIKPFTVSIAGISAYPSPMCPRMIRVGLTTGRDIVMDLRASLKAAFDAACYAYDARDFEPVIGLGRTVTHGEKVDISDAMDAIRDLDFGQTTIDEVCLYGAALLETRPMHTVVGRCPLGGASA